MGSARAYDAVFRQKGVIVAQDIQELIDFSMALSKIPSPQGKRIGILTESGRGRGAFDGTLFGNGFGGSRNFRIYPGEA